MIVESSVGEDRLYFHVHEHNVPVRSQCYLNRVGIVIVVVQGWNLLVTSYTASYKVGICW